MTEPRTRSSSLEDSALATSDRTPGNFQSNLLPLILTLSSRGQRPERVVAWAWCLCHRTRLGVPTIRWYLVGVTPGAPLVTRGCIKTERGLNWPPSVSRPHDPLPVWPMTHL